MVSGRCSDCERLVRHGSTRCLPCENSRFKEKPEFSPGSPLEDDGIRQRFSEIAENRKFRKAEENQARLDAALAWGTAIGGPEEAEVNSSKSSPDSFCSGCGVKLAAASNFCASCGKKRNGTDLSVSTTNQGLYPNRKKSKSSAWVVLLILLVLGGVGYGVYGNISSDGSSENSPQDYDFSSVDSGVGDDSGSWQRVCKTIRTQEDWAPGELTDSVLNGGGGPGSSTTEVCEDVWVP